MRNAWRQNSIVLYAWNLPQERVIWNIRAPALPSVLQNRVRVQRIEGDLE